MLLLLGLVSVVVGPVVGRTVLFREFPFYHSTNDIHARVARLKSNCGAPISVTSQACGENCQIDVVDIGNPSNSRKVFLLFGEHARELISPETALAVMEDLCARNPSRLTATALSHSQFRIIPNGNPAARRLVEGGEYCMRSNVNGVDLNRNWDANWSSFSADDQLNPGQFPFSEKETQIFKSAVADFQPNVFATIHSGTLGMYMPWAYSEASTKAVRNGKKMTEVLSELDTKFCRCPAGGAAREVGYNSPGTCLDWVHSHTKAEYSYAFEIFTGVGIEDLRKRYREQQSSFRTQPQSLLQLDSDYAKDNCFLQFNPETEDAFKRTVSNWSHALIELAIITAAK